MAALLGRQLSLHGTVPFRAIPADAGTARLHSSRTRLPLSPPWPRWHRRKAPPGARHSLHQMSDSRFPALRWTTLLLAASVALTTIGVIEASRAVRSQRAVAEHALRDYAGFAAWSYQQHLQARLGRATEELVGAFNHGHDVHRGDNVPAVESMPHYIFTDRECMCHRPQNGPSPFAFLAFRIGTDTLGVALNAHPDPHDGWEVDRGVPMAMMNEGAQRYTPAVRRWINDTITKQVRAHH